MPLHGMAKILDRLLQGGWAQSNSKEDSYANVYGDDKDETLQAEVNYAFNNAKGFLAFMERYNISPQGRTILEIGPGRDFGAMLVMACHGAQVIVCDRFLAGWDASYHPQFYSALRGRVSSELSGTLTGPIDMVLEAGEYVNEAVRRMENAAEDLSGLLDASVDVIVSNAALEHLADSEKALRELFRVTCPGGGGFHQIDFRDHRDFSQPLEYLLMKDDVFKIEFEKRNGECGNRHRPDDFKRFFQDAGFEILSFNPNIFSEEAYLDDLLPRLRAEGASRYRDIPREQLRSISGRMDVFKPTREGMS